MESTNREVWRSVDGYANYEVSSHGRVRNATTERILTQHSTKKGYLQVGLFKNGKTNTRNVHRLVGCEFIDNPLRKPCIDHIDGDRTNNYVSNLCWATISENSRNCNKRITSASLYKGVVYRRCNNKWQARILVDGKRVSLGVFPTEKDAAIKYNEAAAHYFGEYAKLNETD